MKSKRLNQKVVFFLITMCSLICSQNSPYHSWRVLFVYTNTIDSIYGGAQGPGVNMYNAYFASLVDGMNQVYEESGLDIRAQISGVIWDKVYAIDSPATSSLTDLWNKSNGMQRWANDSIRKKYSTDVIVVVHDPRDGSGQIGAAAWTANGVLGRGHASVWTRYPFHLQVFAHEIGHNYSIEGSADHCKYGHRRVFDAAGNELGGPSPDILSFIRVVAPLGISAPSIVETAIGPAIRGFYTTMAYANGEHASDLVYPCYAVFNHQSNGVWRSFKFQHQGVSDMQNDLSVGWAGVYSNPDVTWRDSLTSYVYPTGHYDTVYYINRLKYLGGPEVIRDSTPYLRNFAALLRGKERFLTDLNGVPLRLNIDKSMSLGYGGADSQWVYSHFVARKSVSINSGFSLSAGSSMKIAVREDGEGLRKVSISDPKLRGSRFAGRSSRKFEIDYNAALKEIRISGSSENFPRVMVRVYDVKGTAKIRRLLNDVNGSFIPPISVMDLPVGPYLIRVVIGAQKFQKRIMKW